MSDIIYEKIKNLGISNRTKNALLRQNIRTVEQILKYSESKVKKIPGLGNNGFYELCKFLRDAGAPNKSKLFTAYRVRLFLSQDILLYLNDP